MPCDILYRTFKGYCDDCVPRSPCSCNFNYDLEAYPKDELGRDLPCVLYNYNPEGFLTDKEFDLDCKFYDVMLRVLLNDRKIK